MRMSKMMPAGTCRDGSSPKPEGQTADGLSRLLEIALAGAALILVAPLMIVTAVASWINERGAPSGGDPRSTWLGAFLYKSSLSELPRLFDVLRGRRSLFAAPRAPTIVRPVLAPQDKGYAQGRQAIPGYASPPGYQMVPMSSALEDLSRNLRNAFFTKVTTEFDDLLRAIDRAQQAFAGAVPAMRTS